MLAEPQRERLATYAKYWDRLVTLALARGMCPDSAQDIAQEAVLRAGVSGKGEQGGRDPWPYLATIASNLARDEHRRRLRERRLIESARMLPVDVVDIEHDVTARDAARRFLDALQEAEGDVTAALVGARVFDQLTWQEMSHRFGMTATAAQARVRRAFLRARRGASALL